MPPLRIDLNCDLGEGGALDEALLEFVTSANIACGVHAGSPSLMRRTVRLAAARGVAPGAHPGLADPTGFGRRETAIEPDAAYDLILYQVGALQAFAALEGRRLQHVKPHGALYNMAARDPALAAAVAAAVRDIDKDLILFALAGSELVKAGRAIGLRVAEEAFADRAVRGDGSLVPRDQNGAVLHDAEQAAARAVRLVKEGRLAAADGRELTIRADTLCVHGDSPEALAILRRLREAFRRSGIEVKGVASL